MVLRVLIADCYHVSVEQEERVFASHGICFDVAKCRTENELIEKGREYDALLVSYVNVSGRVLSCLPRLKLIVKYGVGVDNIDIVAASKLGVHVANVPDYCSEEVAVHAVALTLAGVRKLPFFADAVKQGKWPSATENKPRRLSSLSLGLIGYGRIAKSYYSKMRMMVSGVFVYDPYIGEDVLPDVCRCCSICEVFEKADIIALFIPLTNDTKGIIDSELLEKANGSILINTSRGGLLDYESVASALDCGKLSFLGADVWRDEPAAPDYFTVKLLSRSNVILTPHVGWCSDESEKDLRRKAATVITDYFVYGKEQNFIC